jgi:hypothetical protein
MYGFRLTVVRMGCRGGGEEAGAGAGTTGLATGDEAVCFMEGLRVVSACLVLSRVVLR